jgi:hypothetical protein
MENENNYSHLTPPPIEPEPEFQNQVPQRGGCLTTFLILMMIGNALAILMYLVMGDKITRTARLPSFVPFIMILMGILNLIFAFMIYNWKKAGVYGIIASAAITLIINLAVGLGPSSFGGIVGVIILVALVSPSWKHFT